MKPMGQSRLVSLAAITIASVLATSACGGAGPNKAGGAAPSARTIMLSNALGNPDELLPFAAQVDALSHGALRIEFVNDVHSTDLEFESGVIDDVRAGRAELAWVGSRAWDTFGVTSFDGLHAPMLIDSYELQARVLESPLVDEMGTGLESKGLVSIGVLPGPMRYLLGKSKAFVMPADFAGATVGINKSSVAERTFAALGTKTQLLPLGGATDGFDAIEQQISSILGNNYDEVGKYLTANVALWPRPLVLFMAKSRYDALSSDQQAVLHEAAKKAIRETLRSQVQNEADSATTLCRRGLHFVDATAGDIAALRMAIRPVYDDLERDARTKDLIERITAMKSGATAADQAMSCSQPSASPETTGATALEGTWAVCFTREELLAAGGQDEDQPGNYGCLTLRFRGGNHSASMGSTSFVPVVPNGTYLVDGDQVTIQQPNGEVFDFKWSVFQDTLTFKKVPGKVSSTPLVVKALRRIGD